MDIISSIVFISCPSLRTCSENLDLHSAYLISYDMDERYWELNTVCLTYTYKVSVGIETND